MERKTIGNGVYNAPEISVEEICFEHGFSMSLVENDGFVLGDDTAFGEEDVIW